MIDAAEAMAKVASYCGEIGRDPGEIRWMGGGMLFLNDDAPVQRRAAEIGSELYGERTPEEVMAGDLFGSLGKVRESVRRQVESGLEEIVVFQLPRVHLKSLMRFSEEVIPG
jgi:hypothetical protein